MCAAERLLLHGPAVLAGAEEVEPGLADRAHPRVRRELGDLGVRRLQGRLATGGVDARRLVGVQRDRRDDVLVRRRDLDRPARARQVAADLHDARDADRRRSLERRVDREPRRPDVAVVDVEMAVAVGDGDAQRLRQRRPLELARAAGLLGRRAGAHRPVGARALAHAGASSSRGKRIAPFVTRVPAGSWPHRPASVTTCSPIGPSASAAPSCSHSDVGRLRHHGVVAARRSRAATRRSCRARSRAARRCAVVLRQHPRRLLGDVDVHRVDERPHRPDAAGEVEPQHRGVGVATVVGEQRPAAPGSALPYAVGSGSTPSRYFADHRRRRARRGCPGRWPARRCSARSCPPTRTSRPSRTGWRAGSSSGTRPTRSGR